MKGLFNEANLRRIVEWFYASGKLTTQGWLGTGVVACAGITLVVLAVLVAGVNVPLPESTPGDQVVQASQVLDMDGKVIGTLRGEQNREDVALDNISPYLRRAVVATEDRSFYEHDGVSFRGIVRALFTNVTSGKVVQGGSTITQQYARNAYRQEVGHSRSTSRKIREIDLAQKIEDRYSKDEILALYLNNAYFGRRAYGAQAASLTYFKKPAKDLTAGQAAYLAGVLRAPKRFQVDEDPQAVVRIRNEVLGDMERAGMINEADARQARAENIVDEFKLGPGDLDTAKAGFFIEHVRRVLQTPEFGFTEAEVLRGGLKIHTTLDLRMQVAAEEAVTSTLNLPSDPEVALVAMDTEGNVRAMVGGRDVSDRERARGFNYAANVRSDDGGGRQAGSAFKPFALAALIENGTSIHSRFSGPSSISIKSPRCRNEDGSPWKVSNFGGADSGTIDVMSATVHSTNTVYAQIMDKLVSPEELMRVAGDAGVPIPVQDKGCALTLGTTPVTPMEMARGFTTFAARGNSPEPIMITRIVDPRGRTLKELRPLSHRALAEDTADTVNYVLEDVIRKGTGTGAESGAAAAAGKTGTTQNHSDAWFAGYTPELTAVVWVGYPPDQSGRIPPMVNVHGRPVTGGSFPATIWAKFMQEALKGTKSVEFHEPRLRPEVTPESFCLSSVNPDSVEPDSLGEGCNPKPSTQPRPIPIEAPVPVPAEFTSPDSEAPVPPQLLADPVPPNTQPAPAGGLLGLLLN